MSDNSKIEWTDHTFNPWWGYQKVGPGCDHCYAEALDKRTGGAHWGPHAERRRTKDWSGPRRWQKHARHYMELHGRRQRVFCASMADVFDNAVPPEWRADLWQVIRETPDLDWLLVTKRIGNAPAMVPPDWPLAFPNVTLLITVVNQEEADRDVPKLLAMPAARRGISAEPLLGPIDFTFVGNAAPVPGSVRYDALTGHALPYDGVFGSVRAWATNKAQPCAKLDWIIAGGESGANARPMHPDWVRDIRDQCKGTDSERLHLLGYPDVAFFFKQWGEWTPGENVERQRGSVRVAYNSDPFDGVTWSYGIERLETEGRHVDDEPTLYRVGKSEAGRLLDGREWNEYPAPDGAQRATASAPSGRLAERESEGAK